MLEKSDFPKTFNGMKNCSQMMLNKNIRHKAEYVILGENRQYLEYIKHSTEKNTEEYAPECSQ